MKPELYEPWQGERRRLSGLLQSRGSRTGLPAWANLVFGGLVAVVGVGFMLIGTRSVFINASRTHTPNWMLTAAGVSFALFGLMACGMASGQFMANRRRLQAARQHPEEPALQDYAWHPGGFELSPWTGVVKVVALAAGTTVFLSMFNWWAFAMSRDWMLRAIVMVLDGVGLVLWWQAAMKLGRALKFGQSRVGYTRFPYRLGEPVILRWRPGSGIARVRKGSFSLRCVEEWLEWSGSGKQRTRKLVQEELWNGTWVLAQPRTLQVTDSVELQYELPADARPTCLCGERPVFWELEVKLDLSGLDFIGTYLVPIYGPKAITRQEPVALGC